MVIAELLVDVEVYSGLKLSRNKEYVMAGAVMKQLSKIYPGAVSVTRDFSSVYSKLDLSKIQKGQEVFLFRSGGIGDVMFMFPLISFLKKNFGVKIKVGTSPIYCSVLENNPDIDTIVRMPFSLEEMKKSDFHLIFEGIIEDVGNDSQILHSVDLFLKEAGVDHTRIPAKDKCPRLFIKDSEIKKAKKVFSKYKILESEKKIGVQVESSSPVRNYPLNSMIAVIRRLIDSGYVVIVFGGKFQKDVGEYFEQVFAGERRMVNLINKTESLRESIAIISLMDLIVAPDSSFIHIAGALDIPVVGIYGCFPSLLRMRYYKNAIGIDCNVSCAPSFIHGHNPCGRGFPSPCFSVISPQNVIDAVSHLLGGKKISLIYPTFNVFRGGELKESPFIDGRFKEK